MHYLVTGAAGFIGSHIAARLLEGGHRVTGIDNLNAYYDPRLKRDRLAWVEPKGEFTFDRIDIADRAAMADLFANNAFDRVVHTAAQAGVRHSLTHPEDYADSNLVGFLNVLEGCRATSVGHLVYASSSSVYGANQKLPYSTDDNVDHPINLYAATKKANELMAHSYSHLYGLPTTGLRFFTVYGPWGRPDMAPLLFTGKIFSGAPIDVFNEGRHARDFTYIDDVVEGIVRVCDLVPEEQADSVPHSLYNIGSSSPVELLDFIAALEKAIGRKAEKNMLPRQPGDMERTFADIAPLVDATGYRPSTKLDDGVARLVDWYRRYYRTG